MRLSRAEGVVMIQKDPLKGAEAVRRSSCGVQGQHPSECLEGMSLGALDYVIICNLNYIDTKQTKKHKNNNLT